MDQDFGASLAMQPVKMEGVKMETGSAPGDPPPESDRQSEQEQIEKNLHTSFALNTPSP